MIPVRSCQYDNVRALAILIDAKFPSCKPSTTGPEWTTENRESRGRVFGPDASPVTHMLLSLQLTHMSPSVVVS